MKEIYQAGGDKATRMYVITGTGLWDSMSIFERQEWFEKGKIYDSPAGRTLLQMILTA